jgi:hypothetical protein
VPGNGVSAWSYRIAQKAETRLYPADSLERLTLLKRLIDNGESISVLADLESDALRERLDQFSETHISSQPSFAKKTIHAVALSNQIKYPSIHSTKRGIEVEFKFASPDRESMANFLKANSDSVDTALLQLDILPSKQPNFLEDWVMRFPGISFIVVYELGSNRELIRLLDKGVKCLRGPLPEPMLIDHLATLIQPVASVEQVPVVAAARAIFTSDQLTKLANLPSSIQCECPSHMSAIINSLNAFEAYSKECESTSKEDAELHAELAIETAKARTLMERMLLKVCTQDNIKI